MYEKNCFLQTWRADNALRGILIANFELAEQGGVKVKSQAANRFFPYQPPPSFTCDPWPVLDTAGLQLAIGSLLMCSEIWKCLPRMWCSSVIQRLFIWG